MLFLQAAPSLVAPCPKLPQWQRRPSRDDRPCASVKAAYYGMLSADQLLASLLRDWDKTRLEDVWDLLGSILLLFNEKSSDLNEILCRLSFPIEALRILSEIDLMLLPFVGPVYLPFPALFILLLLFSISSMVPFCTIYTELRSCGIRSRYMIRCSIKARYRYRKELTTCSDLGKRPRNLEVASCR